MRVSFRNLGIQMIRKIFSSEIIRFKIQYKTQNQLPTKIINQYNKWKTQQNNRVATWQVRVIIVI